jgi:hypothetical protein
MRSRSNSARTAKMWKTSLPPGGGGVDGLQEAAEPDAAVGQAGDGVDQVSEGAAEAVEFPDDQGIAGRSWSRSWPLAGRSLWAPLAASVEHPIAAGASQGVDLELGLLVGGGRRWRSQAGDPCRERRRTLCQGWLCDVDSGHGFWTRRSPWPGGCGSCRRDERFWIVDGDPASVTDQHYRCGQ